MIDCQREDDKRRRIFIDPLLLRDAAKIGSSIGLPGSLPTNCRHGVNFQPQRGTFGGDLQTSLSSTDSRSESTCRPILYKSSSIVNGMRRHDHVTLSVTRHSAAEFYDYRNLLVCQCHAGTSAGFWLGGQCPLAAWGEDNFKNLTTKWCILKYI